MWTTDAKETIVLGRPERILIIEDESSIREAIAQSLQQECYDVLTAADGTAGLALALSANEQTGYSLDLLILDLILPDIDGLDLCRNLRSSGNNVPILAISARSSEADRVLGLDTGADDYLTKPFGMRELIARCRALLRHWQRQPAALLRVRDIALNLRTSIVSVRGREVYLSPRELQLLEFFMQNPHQVWSREQLVKRIWGSDFMGDFKTLDVHIRWLREKLETNPSKPEYIITMRGFGYRFG